LFNWVKEPIQPPDGGEVECSECDSDLCGEKGRCLVSRGKTREKGKKEKRSHFLNTRGGNRGYRGGSNN